MSAMLEDAIAESIAHGISLLDLLAPERETPAPEEIGPNAQSSN